MSKGLDKCINNINFRKTTKLYIIVSLLLLVVVLACAAYVFKDKIAFSISYLKIDNYVDKRGIDTSVKGRLNDLADSTPDIKDVLLLDKNNVIIYSSKSTILGKNNKLLLTKAKDKPDFLQDVNSPWIYYKVIKPERLVLMKDLYKGTKDIKAEYTDDFFYDTDYNAQEVHYLNYFADKQSGMKIFVISDIKPTPFAERMVELLVALLMLILGFYWILIALWVYRDANKRKLNSALWGMLILLTNLVGVIVYTIYKQNNLICYNCGALQSKQNIFCNCCGTRMNKSCEKCGMMVSGNDQYCSACGTKLDN